MTVTLTPVKYVAAMNLETLPENTDRDFAFKYVDISAVSSEGHIDIPKAAITFGAAPSRARRIASPGSVIVSTVRTYLRAVAAVPRTDDNLIYSTGFAVLTPRRGTDSRYLAYACRSDRFVEEVVAQSTGVSYPAINPSELGQIPIPIPPCEEQRRIADFLDDQVARIDNVIAARRRHAELASELLQQIIRDAVAGAAGETDGRASSVPWVSRLGKGSMLLPMARIATLQRGVDLTADEHRPGHIAVVTTAGVVGTHDTAIVNHPGVVVGRYGSSGSVMWIDRAHWPHNTTLYVRDYHGNDPRWVYFLLKTFPFEMLQARSAVPGINRNDMAGDPMPWMPLPDQTQAVRRMVRAEEETRHGIALMEASADSLKALKRSLITAAVSGEFDVSSADGSRVPV